MQADAAAAAAAAAAVAAAIAAPTGARPTYCRSRRTAVPHRVLQRLSMSSPP